MRHDWFGRAVRSGTPGGMGVLQGSGVRLPSEPFTNTPRLLRKLPAPKEGKTEDQEPYTIMWQEENLLEGPLCTCKRKVIIWRTKKKEC
jgi:hypothetical protein